MVLDAGYHMIINCACPQTTINPKHMFPIGKVSGRKVSVSIRGLNPGLYIDEG